MELRTIEWKLNAIKIIDQTKLPLKLEYVTIRDVKTLWHAIRTMKIRGAPALGAAAALGVYLGIKDAQTTDFKKFSRYLDKIMKYIASSRPTARNLFWALERAGSIAIKNRKNSISAIKRLILEDALAIIEEDRIACRLIGTYGAKLIRNNDTILTICNAGILATIDYGTALGVMYHAHEEGKKIKVYACETRPMLQGARLTSWELKQKGVNTTLICDNMSASLMKQGKIDKVIAGADRVVANGDAANKIGTYYLAVLSHFHTVPFYIAAPQTTFDLRLSSGEKIPIEQRPAFEMTELFFKKPIAPPGIKVYNPAFDVTPHSLITAHITDKGIIRPPYRKNIATTIG